MSDSSSPNTPDNPETKQRMEEVKQALVEYGEKEGLRGLEGRLQRGLDPAGMLAVPVTRSAVQKLADRLGASMSEVEKLTKELHVGAIWQNGSKLAEAEDPNVKVWMVMADACTGDNMGDLNEAAFLHDMENVIAKLEQAGNSDEVIQAAIAHNTETAHDKFEMDGEIPVSKTDDAFLHMAISGHEAGVVVDDSGLAFVGADQLNFEEVARRYNLKEIEKEDRGRVATFYVKQNEDGSQEDVIKKLYPGFGIVLTGNLEIAKALAATGMKKKQGVVGETRSRTGKIV